MNGETVIDNPLAQHDDGPPTPVAPRSPIVSPPATIDIDINGAPKDDYSEISTIDHRTVSWPHNYVF